MCVPKVKDTQQLEIEIYNCKVFLGIMHRHMSANSLEILAQALVDRPSAKLVARFQLKPVLQIQQQY
jgi:hypothetical protein